jgi:hypothetical protein
MDSSFGNDQGRCNGPKRQPAHHVAWTSRSVPKSGLFICAILSLVLLQAVAEPPALIEGIQSWQVFPRQGQVGEISFRASGSGELVAELFRAGDQNPILRREWSIVASNPTQLVLSEVPVGGEYTLRFRLGERQVEFRHLLVGEIWLVGGQSNAVGTSHRPEKPSPGVHYLRDHRWGEGADPLFPPIFPLPPGETHVAAWRRGAQRYYELTGIPVGLMGWAFGGVPMSRFWDTDIREMPDFKPLVAAHGRGASVYLWYQGESDANTAGISVYRERLAAMAAAIRRYAANPDLLMVVVQLSFRSEPSGHETPYYGRICEQQRQFCAQDPRSILIPAMPYPHLDVVHLDFEGYQALGNRVGECLADLKRTGRVAWQGPRLVGARFTDQSRRSIRVDFDSATPLKLLESPLGAGTYGKGHKPEMDWFVTDDQHQGYAELLATKIENGQVRLDVAGASIEVSATQVGEKAIRAPLLRTGYLPVRHATAEGTTVFLELAEPARPGAKLSYGLMTGSLSTLVDGHGLAAAVFANVPVAEP